MKRTILEFACIVNNLEPTEQNKAMISGLLNLYDEDGTVYIFSSNYYLIIMNKDFSYSPYNFHKGTSFMTNYLEFSTSDSIYPITLQVPELKLNFNTGTIGETYADSETQVY